MEPEDHIREAFDDGDMDDNNACANDCTSNCTPGALTFNYTGGVQSFVACSNTIKVEAWGAQGGAEGSAAGGKGGYVTADVTVTPGSTVYIYVGGAGLANQSCGAKGGYNGGGDIGFICCSNAGALAGTGGGASDIRIGGQTFNDRIIVAAGGGGAGSNNPGGAGGGLIGANGGQYQNVTATGGTQVAGGQPGGHYSSHVCSAGTAGSFGQGGVGDGNDGGGAGGGWYGGGGGPNNGGGAGGSSYLHPQLTSNGTTSTGIQSGNGQVKISWI